LYFVSLLITANISFGFSVTMIVLVTQLYLSYTNITIIQSSER